MDAALLGFAGVAVAAILTLVGAIVTHRAPRHLADVEGLAKLADEQRTELDRVYRQLADCRTECDRLRGSSHA